MLRKKGENMKYRTLGKSEIQISSIIMGTWQAGKKMWADIDDTEIEKALKAAFDSGITTFDTAEEYGRGHSERTIGRALSDVRKQVVYLSKVFPTHFKYDQVIKACHRSLKNLNTDYIDLYQIHWPSGSFGTKKVPVEETLGALNDLKKQGKIRAIGVSNFSKTQIEKALQYGCIESLQPPYSLFWRHVEKDAMPFCIENNITILAYSSLSQGILTGKFGPDHKFAPKDHRSGNRLFKPENFKNVLQALEKLKPFSEKYNVSMTQLALAWVIAQPMTCAIAGARNAQQIVHNAKAVDICISDKDLSELDLISRIVTANLDDNPVLWG